MKLARKKSFTLIELIVSLGVFSVLTLMLMQFFTSVQQAWTSSERRARIYADSRVVFDMVATAAKSSADIADCDYNGVSSISFKTVQPDGETLAPFQLYLNDNTLYREGNQPVLYNVLDFRVSTYNQSFTGHTPVAFIQVEYEVMDDVSFKIWKETDSADFRRNNAYKFMRIITLQRF